MNIQVINPNNEDLSSLALLVNSPGLFHCEIIELANLERSKISVWAARGIKS